MNKKNIILVISLLSSSLYAQSNFFGSSFKYYSSPTRTTLQIEKHNKQTYTNNGENNYYIGISGIGGYNVETTVLNSNSSSKFYDLTGMGIKFGFIQNNKDRIEISVNKLFTNNEAYYGLETNYLCTLRNNKTINPYVGFGVGVYKNSSSNNQANPTAYSLGLNGGFLISLTNQIELELGYQFKHLEWNYSDVRLYNNLTTASIGTNIKF